jgi:hypothetical protein
LAGGSLGRPVHGEVAGFRGGEVAGEAMGRDRGKRMVRCVRGEVCEPLQFDSKLLERGGRAHRSEGRRRRRARLNPGEGEWPRPVRGEEGFGAGCRVRVRAQWTGEQSGA